MPRLWNSICKRSGMKLRRRFFRDTWRILKDSMSEFLDDRVFRLSAALAYYTVFSLPSMLIIIIGLGSLFFGKDAIQGEVFTTIDQFVGAEAAHQIQEVLRNTSMHHDNLIATLIGFGTLLFGATGMFGEIQGSINQIWGLKTKPNKNLIKLLLNRLLSFSMVLVLGFILLVSLILNAILEALFHRLKVFFSGDMVTTLLVADQVVMIAVIALLFAFIFKVLPDAKIRWKDVWVGAVVTSLLFLLGKFLIGYYLQHNASINAYGAAGSLIVILLWVYYSSLILYFGAEFTQVYVRYRGRAIAPNRYAVWVEEQYIARRFNTEIHDTPAIKTE